MTDLPDNANPLEVAVSDDKAGSRYVGLVGDQVVGLIDYVEHDDRVVFTHAEVKPEWEGRGIAGRIARFALDDVIARGKRITPLCPFVVEYVRRNPSYVAHIDDKHREQFQTGSTGN